MHNEQSGAVTMLLIEKMMSSSHSGISRLCDSVACRRLEVLLSEDEQVGCHTVTDVSKCLTSECRCSYAAVIVTVTSGLNALLCTKVYSLF